MLSCIMAHFCGFYKSVCVYENNHDILPLTLLHTLLVFLVAFVIVTEQLLSVSQPSGNHFPSSKLNFTTI